MHPDTFWSLTPAEIFTLHDGWKYRDEQEMLRVAWQTAHIVNAQGNQVTINQLLGRDTPSEEYDEEDKEEKFEKLMELLEQKRNATL